MTVSVRNIIQNDSKGYTGSKGDAGGPGYTGSHGTLGYTGSAGLKGDAGSPGYTGSQGALGYTGSQGSTGYVGSSGTLGYTGSRGYAGSKGDAGSLGYTGSKGAFNISFQSTAPSSPTVGDEWIDENTGVRYTYFYDGDSYQWVEFSNAGTMGYTGSASGNPIIDPVIVGTITEDVYTITDGTAFEIDPANGSIQLITLGANRTPKATNFNHGQAVTMMIGADSYTLTWTDTTFGPSGVKWIGDSAPTLDAIKLTVIVLWKVLDQVYGALVGTA